MEKNGVDKLLEAASEPDNFKALLNLGHEYLNKKQSQKKEEMRVQLSDRVYSVIVLALCLASVIFLSYTKILDGVTTGTLIGAIIGYGLARTKNSDAAES